jgi:MFS family permease
MTIQAYESTINADAGVAALGVLYAFFALSNVVASYVVKYVAGTKRNRLVMGLSALTYVVFIAVHLYPNEILLIVASVPIGIGASTLWTAQGSFLSQHGDETSYGLLAGIFFFFFALTSVLGNAFGGAFFAAGGTTFVFVIVLAVVASCNFIFLFLMKDPTTIRPLTFREESAVVVGYDDATNISHDTDGDEHHTDGDAQSRDGDCAASDKKQSALSHMLGTLKMFCEKRMLLLMPLIMWYGLASAFWYSAVPTRLVVDDRQVEVGWLNVVFGIANAVMSIVGGKLGDNFGRATVINAALIVSVVGCTLALFIGLPGQHRIVPFIIAVFFGL